MIELTKEWSKQGMARAVPGARWDGATKAWVLDDLSARAAAVTLKLFPELGVAHPELIDLRNDLLHDVRPFDNATPFGRRIAAPRVRAAMAERGWELFDYQALDLGYLHAVLCEHGAGYVGWERGMGKTIGAACLMDELDWPANLVVCPNTAKESTWAAELAWAAPWLEVLVLPNDKAKRQKCLGHAQQLHAAGKPFVLVVHYEALAVIAGAKYSLRGKAEDHADRPDLERHIAPAEHRRLGKDDKARYRKVMGDGWAKLGIDWFMVTDEDHRLSNPEAQMFKASKRVPSRFRLLMSGSIIQNHLEELFSPAHRAFPKRYRAKWRDWNDRFLDYVDSGYGKVCVGILPGAVDVLRAELGAWMVYRRKADELDLPARVEDRKLVDLSPAQRKAYDQLVRECLTELADGTRIKAEAGIAMMGRLRQVATGLDLLTDQVKDSSKLDLAEEMIVDGQDDDFVVFSWYKSAVHALADRLNAKGIGSFVVTGDVPHAKRAEAIARFQQGEGRVFIGTLATLGESVNLQRANNAIFLDRSWNPGMNSQAEDRIYRQGQQRKVTITHIIARDTVDELNVLPTLASKEALRAAILGGV